MVYPAGKQVGEPIAQNALTWVLIWWVILKVGTKRQEKTHKNEKKKIEAGNDSENLPTD